MCGDIATQIKAAQMRAIQRMDRIISDDDFSTRDHLEAAKILLVGIPGVTGGFNSGGRGDSMAGGGDVLALPSLEQARKIIQQDPIDVEAEAK